MLFGVLKGQGEVGLRAGIVTSRKVGNAVVRNRVRRRLREIVRHARPGMPPGTWLVIVAKSAAAKADFGTLRDEWMELAKKARLLSE